MQAKSLFWAYSKWLQDLTNCSKHSSYLFHPYIIDYINMKTETYNKMHKLEHGTSYNLKEMYTYLD